MDESTLSLIEPVSFEMNAQLLRAFGPATLNGLSNANQVGHQGGNPHAVAASRATRNIGKKQKGQASRPLP